MGAERFYTTHGAPPTTALGDRADVRFAAPAYHDANTGKLVLLMDELIVRFKRGVTRADVEALGARVGTRIVQAEGTLGTNRYLLAVTRASPANALHVALAYAALPTAEYAEPNLVSRITYL